jgi:putative aldouronate transport system substrate-binding protein
MKKFSALLTAALLAFSFVACSSGQSSDGQPSAEQSSGAGSTAETREQAVSAEDAYTVKVTWFVSQNEPASLKVTNEEMNKLTLEKAGILVDLMPIPYSSWDQQMNLMMSSGEKLDATVIIRDNFGPYVTQGRVLPIDDLMTRYGQGAKAAVDDLNPLYMEVGKVNGETFGIPTLRDLARGFGLAVNKELADEIGMDLTKAYTMDEVGELLGQVKDKWPDIVPIMPQNPNGSMINTMTMWDALTSDAVLMNFGQDEPLKVELLYETEQYREMVYRMRDWYQKGYILADVSTTTDMATSYMKADRLFCYSTNLKPGFDNQESLTSGKEIVSVTYINPFTDTNYAGYFLWGIASNSKNPEAAMKYLNLAYTDTDIADMLSWGLKGTDWVQSEQDPDLITYPEGFDSSNTGWGLNMGWLMGNQYITHVWEGDSPDLYVELQDYCRGAVVSKAMGFTFDSSPVKNQITAVTNVREQYQLNLEDGLSDPDVVLPEFIAAMKANGVDDIVAEAQKQLDAWLANK